MSYPLLVLLVVLSALLLAAILVACGARPRIGAIAMSVLGVSVLTAIFDPFIIYFGLVDYDPSTLAGPRLGPAPIEDFSYAIAAAILGPSVYSLLQRNFALRGRLEEAKRRTKGNRGGVGDVWPATRRIGHERGERYRCGLSATVLDQYGLPVRNGVAAGYQVS